MTKYAQQVKSLAIALIALTALTGCSKSPSSPTSTASTDQTLATAAMTVNPNLVADDVFSASASTAAFGAKANGRNDPAAAIDPRYFWRHITSSTRSITFAFSDSDSTGRPRQADAVVTRHLMGTFNILKAMPTDSTHFDSANVVHKNLDDTWVRHLHLQRVASGDSGHTEWHVVKVSGAMVTSAGATTQIQSLRLQGGGVDTTITDPLQYWTLAHTFAFAAGDSITLTVTTNHTDDIVLGYWHDSRERFRNNGDGTYTRVLHIQSGDSGYRWCGVNALSHGTLFDDALPYDSRAWIMHCFIGPRPSGDHF